MLNDFIWHCTEKSIDQRLENQKLKSMDDIWFISSIEYQNSGGPCDNLNVWVQAHWRGRQVRQSVACQRSAALTLQKHWRAARLRRAFHADVARIVTAQAAVRRSACCDSLNFK